MTLLWVGISNGVPLLVGLGSPDFGPTELIFFYGIMNGLFPPIAVILILQDSIVGEKRSGTAAWVLSKPVPRKAFILAKWTGNSLNLFITMSFIPGIIAFFEILAVTGQIFSFVSFLGAILILGLNLIFYISFTLMLGTFQNSPGAVAAVPMIFNFGQPYLMNIPFVSYFLPISFFLPNPTGNPVITSLILGEEIFSILPVVVTGIFAILFTIIAFWRFEKEEL
jgi:ABC-2 type transport system permease protein